MTKMKDVAKLAGVSIATVSAVVNNNKYVSDKLRNKIEDAIRELDYRPNRIARSLKGKGTNLIGATVTEMTNPFYPLMLKGIDDAAKASGYNVLLSTTQDNKEEELKIMESMIDQKVDGVILSTVDELDSSVLRLLEENNVPTILINRTPDNYRGASITVDSIKVGEIATQYLLDLGHKEIAYFGGNRLNSIKREQGFKNIMNQNSLAINEEWVFNVKYDFNLSYQVAQQLIKQVSKKPTAIFTASDYISMGVSKAILDEGLSIPKDISIIGSDNIPFSADFRIPLTTVEVQSYKMGKESFNRLNEMILTKGRNLFDQIILEPKLIIRASTASPTNVFMK